MSTLGKELEKIIATGIAHAVVEYGLLPAEHCGGRKLTSSGNALHMVMEAVHAAWKSEAVATLLMMDVSGAFD